MESRFETSARAGDAVGTLQQAVLNGALWAVGMAWANAFRETTRALLPEDTMDIVLAELLAAGITTALAVGVVLCTTRSCRSCSRRDSLPAAPERPGTRYPHLYT